MTKLQMKTSSLADENFAKLQELFPGVVTEAIDENGATVRAVDAERLAQEINTRVLSEREERYQFTWPEKAAARVLANMPINKALRPCREESVNFDTTENLYIEGDNLDVLKLLRETYLNRVKMIYIDPPYNTGSDFVYRDNWNLEGHMYTREMSGDYDEDGNRMVRNLDSNGRFHTDWLNMIYPRLRVARDLLSEDGVIFISIDDNEVHNLRKICDEIFGERNFVALLPWKGRGGGADDKNLLNNHEYVLFYAKNLVNFAVGRKIKKGEVFPKFDNRKKRNYKTQLARKWGSNAKKEDRPNLFYPIISSNGIEVFPKLADGSDGRWRWSKERMLKAIENDEVEFAKRDDGYWEAYEKIYEPLEGEFNTQLFAAWLQDEINDDLIDLIEDTEAKTTAFGTRQLKQLFENKAFFDYPKPTNLLEVLVKMSNANDNHIVLDFFSGSATTAHAVMKLNAEEMLESYKLQGKSYEGGLALETSNSELVTDSSNSELIPAPGRRRFIMVQLPEATDEKSEAYKAGYRNICEIGKERIRRAGRELLVSSYEVGDGSYEVGDGSYEVRGKSYEGELNLETRNSKLVTNSSNSELVTRNSKLDIGFRVLKLDSSNMKEVFYTPGEVVEMNLDGLSDNIESGRTGEDLLFQVMLELGIPLSAKIEELAGVFYVNENYLIACFERVDNTRLTEIARKQPYYAVFRDGSFASDSAMVNFEQIFKTYSPSTTRRVL